MPDNANCCWALYIRLSHEDGDNAESLSVSNQKLKLTEYIKKLDNNSIQKFYIDDGFSGTTFDRPGFKKLLYDIEHGLIKGILVKDLSRLGRNSPKTSYFIHDYFPAHKIRFIAIDDNIDKNFFDIDTSNDMIIDIKNLFNGFYPRDISSKVRSTFRAKQKAGHFIGAFACYGYKKSLTDHNKLIIDPVAADIVKKIFSMYLSGKGQNTIAKILNSDNIPCPSEYKKMQGLNYKNSNRLTSTTYWTYSSIRSILKNEIYTGCMVQNKSFRMMCSKSASPLPHEKWIIVPDTHEAIIDKKTFDIVQSMLSNNVRQMKTSSHTHILAGLLKCGDCGRAMVKIKNKDKIFFVCGSYNRYGTDKCSSHKISESTILNIISDDFNNILKNTENFKQLLKNEPAYAVKTSDNSENNNYILNRLRQLNHKKMQFLENLNENLITHDEFETFVSRCNEQIYKLQEYLTPHNAYPKLSAPCKIHSVDSNTPQPCNRKTDKQIYPKSLPDIIYEIIKKNRITIPDRIVVTQMVSCIYIYKNNRLKIIYNFDNDS